MFHKHVEFKLRRQAARYGEGVSNSSVMEQTAGVCGFLGPGGLCCHSTLAPLACQSSWRASEQG